MKTKAYRIQQPYYRAGAYYEAGSVVHIPADEKPSRTWEALDADALAKAPVSVEAPKAKGRASDGSPV